ncbi:MAG: DUF4199 domain-containing protein [Marinicella sp.]
MKKIILVNGLIASLIISGVSSLMLWTSVNDTNFSQSEWFGYLIMIVGLSVIFVAVKQHRENNLGGVIGFKTAFLIGFLITLIASLFYVAAWEVYYQTAGQDFMSSYQNSYLENLKLQGMSEASINKTMAEMADFSDMYAKFHFRAFITLLEILPVGLVIALFSALLLRTKSSG